MVKALAGLFLVLMAPSVFAQPPDWEVDAREHHTHGARILVLKNYHLGAGETARGPIIVLGGSATIDGHADDDVVVLGGRVRVGPQAVVDGEVVTVGGEAIVDPNARMAHGVDANVIRFPDIDGGWHPLSRHGVAGLALAGTILRLLFVFLVASVLTLVAPGWVRRISWRAREGMISSAAIGFACQVAFLPVLLLLIVALAVSIVGIPLIGAMPFLVVAAGISGVAGFTAVAARIGARVRGTTVESSNALWVDALIGTAVVSALTVFTSVAAFGAMRDDPLSWSIGAAGLVIEYVVWTIGIGAACATVLGRWKGSAPSPAVA